MRNSFHSKFRNVSIRLWYKCFMSMLNSLCNTLTFTFNVEFEKTRMIEKWMKLWSCCTSWMVQTVPSNIFNLMVPIPTISKSWSSPINTDPPGSYWWNHSLREIICHVAFDSISQTRTNLLLPSLADVAHYIKFYHHLRSLLHKIFSFGFFFLLKRQHSLL